MQHQSCEQRNNLHSGHPTGIRESSPDNSFRRQSKRCGGGSDSTRDSEGRKSKPGVSFLEVDPRSELEVEPECTVLVLAFNEAHAEQLRVLQRLRKHNPCVAEEHDHAGKLQEARAKWRALVRTEDERTTRRQEVQAQKASREAASSQAASASQSAGPLQTAGNRLGAIAPPTGIEKRQSLGSIVARTVFKHRFEQVLVAEPDAVSDPL
eukprot:4216765-Prymnesium_polylepis.3